jgi:hypothetical protein
MDFSELVIKKARIWKILFNQNIDAQLIAVIGDTGPRIEIHLIGERQYAKTMEYLAYLNGAFEGIEIKMVKL